MDDSLTTLHIAWPHKRLRPGSRAVLAGAEIRCAKGDHVCGLSMEGHPFHGATFGAVGTVTLLVDLWIEGRLLPHMRAAPP